MLQNSKVAVPRIFRENKKRETITNSYTLSRGAEIASEFNARGSVPSRLYTEDAPTARGIFDHLCKTTFATQSELKQTCLPYLVTSGFDPRETYSRSRLLLRKTSVDPISPVANPCCNGIGAA